MVPIPAYGIEKLPRINLFRQSKPMISERWQNKHAFSAMFIGIHPCHENGSRLIIGEIQAEKPITKPSSTTLRAPQGVCQQTFATRKTRDPDRIIEHCFQKGRLRVYLDDCVKKGLKTARD